MAAKKKQKIEKIVNFCNNNKKNSKRKKKQQHFLNEDDYRLRSQEGLYTPDYILTKIFRKDGPILGGEFDSLPSNAFTRRNKGSRISSHSRQENEGATKRRKVSAPASMHCRASCESSRPVKKQGIGKGLITSKDVSVKKYGTGKGLMTEKSATVRKYGLGKGLMTVWRATNPHAGDTPTGVDLGESAKERKEKLQQRQSILRKIEKKLQDKKKVGVKCRKAVNKRIEKQKPPRKEKCELALERRKCQEGLPIKKRKYQEEFTQLGSLVDDEELELMELEAGPNSLTWCTHFASSGLRGCSLCKGLLPKFPPDSVIMKLPLYMRPWDSSPELVKKLFKIFHFLCTYAARIDICSFTIDEFAQSFHEKDSLLLGQVHLALLRLLLADVEIQLDSGFIHQASRSCNFLGLVHSIEHEEFSLKLWISSLNALTWTEILRQVLVAAGFGSKRGRVSGEALSKEVSLMAKYGLAHGTLKGELFSILLIKGTDGMKVHELAKLQSIVELNLAATTIQLEDLISSTLSSDITLFEKISSSGYRLRINPSSQESEISFSDSEGDVAEVISGYIRDYSDCESRELVPAESGRRYQLENRNSLSPVNTEIDESYSGEAWLLGLMEGEYSDLGTEEKLNALVALVDLLTAASSIAEKDPMPSTVECAPATIHHASGGKIKRSSAKSSYLAGQTQSHNGYLSNQDPTGSLELQPVDSSVSMSKICQKNKSPSTAKNTKELEDEDDLHPMQSIFLGSDRRYNRYWIFLGPCNELDPGHRRIYFESSEDGHWEVIDTEESLCSLLAALDRRGTREALLVASLEKRETFLCQAMSNMLNDSGDRQSPQRGRSYSREDSSSSAVSDVDNLGLVEMHNGSTGSKVPVGRKGEHQQDKWNSTQAFDSWMWKSFYCNLAAVKRRKRSYLESLEKCDQCHDLYWRDEKHCMICHTTFELDFDLEERYAIHTATCRQNLDPDNCTKHKILPSELQSFKAAIHAIESVIPEDALIGAWRRSSHNLWIKRLRRASTLSEILQVLADFVTAMNKDCCILVGQVGCLGRTPLVKGPLAIYKSKGRLFQTGQYSLVLG
ncbi:hypothetical protein K7X08_021608 [Anisodus acutangulus]|uniref:DDT domain-containing protein n=1 Tax=Anisodus acutangulus TaxID=402998 RepID=A0A9Q1M7Y6_9SOLA|nr:hypothetical protein K7X08_021608 [Anisodus acutangulus]